MNTKHDNSISTITIVASAIAAATLAGFAPPANAADSLPIITVTPRHEIPSMNHELRLENGESLRLAHLHRIATYRFCVDPFNGSVPLRVLVDGTESLVGVASCETVTGEHINVGPAEKLPGGDYLVARFQRVGRKSEENAS